MDQTDDFYEVCDEELRGKLNQVKTFTLLMDEVQQRMNFV